MIKEKIKKLLWKHHLYKPVYKLYISLVMCFPAKRRKRFCGYFDAFLEQLDRAAPYYTVPTVVFFGHMGDGRKMFYSRLAAQLEDLYPNNRVLFVDRGPDIKRKSTQDVLAQLRKHGLLKMEEEHGGPKDWKSRFLKLEYTEEMRALMAEKPYLRQAVSIARGAFGETAPNYLEAMTCLCYRCYDALLSKINVTGVNIWNEFRFNHYLLAEMCRERGIGVSFMEFGSLPGTLVFDRRGQMGESAPAVDYEEFRQLGVTEEELARAEEVVAWLKASGLNRNKQPSEEMEEKEELKRLRPDRPVVLFAGQWDMASGMIPYTEDARKYHSPVFGSSLEALLALAKLAEKHDWNLIFKPHPSVQEEYDPAALPDNVILVKKYNINELIDLSDVVATILSSTAYVSLIRDRATVMLGYNQLRSKGCTYDAFRPEDVEKALTAAVEQGYTAEQRAAFIRHVAQMSKYYLYQDGEKRDGPVYGRPLDQLALEFRPVLAAGRGKADGGEREDAALFICSTLPAVFTAAHICSRLPEEQKRGLILLNAAKAEACLDMDRLREQFGLVESLRLESPMTQARMAKLASMAAENEPEEESSEELEVPARTRGPAEAKLPEMKEEPENGDASVEPDEDEEAAASDEEGLDTEEADKPLAMDDEHVRELLPGWGELYFHQLSPAALSLIRGVMQANEDVHLHAFDDGSEKYRSNEPMQRLLRRSFIRYFGREEAAEMITALRETRLSSMKNVKSGSTPRFDLIQTFSNWNENGIAYAPVFNDRDYPLFEMLKVADTNKLEAARCFQLVRMISSWL